MIELILGGGWKIIAGIVAALGGWAVWRNRKQQGVREERQRQEIANSHKREEMAKVARPTTSDVINQLDRGSF